jgi:tetratricopeptide (TPR) repeat protein
VDFAERLQDLKRMIASGKTEAARKHYEHLCALADDSGPAVPRLDLEMIRARLLAAQDEYRSAIDLAESLLRRFQALGLRDRVAGCHLMLSGLRLRTGDYPEARAHAEAAVYFATWEVEDTALRSDAHNNLGLALKDLGMWEEAERHFRRALEATESDRLRSLRISLNLAILLRKTGKIVEAEEICRDGLKASREAGLSAGVARYGLELANLSLIRQDSDEVRECLRIAGEAIEESGYRRERILALEIEGDLLCLEDDLERAIESYDRGLALSRDLAAGGDLEAEILRRRAQAALRFRRAEEAESLAEEALLLDRRTGDSYEQGICLRVIGEAEISLGKMGTAVEHLEKSVKILSGLSPWCAELARAEQSLGEALTECSGNGAGIGHLLDARRIYSNIGVGARVRALDEMVLSALERLPAGGASVTSRSRRRHSGPALRIDPLEFGMVTCDERIVGDLDQWGPTEARVLIEGDTGVGKELMARALHGLSRRREAAFVAVDCGALSETLADSELFGHARGAFTGAMRERQGLIEAADGGTLFLDEIGELSEALQVKLLRVLENGVLRRVGENTPRRVDVRVISATARDLWAEVESGQFRRDLYYRLKTVLVRIPSLTQRPHDLVPLIEHYLNVFSERHNLPARLTPEALDRLTRYQWPGNIRELKNTLEALVLSAGDGEITVEHTRRFLPESGAEAGLKEQIADLEQEEIERALKASGGNRTRAAEILGISRKTLWQKLRKMNRS